MDQMIPVCRNGHGLAWHNISFGHGWCQCLTCGARTRPDVPLLEDRLWAQSTVDTNTGCWLWTGTVNKKGYGQVKVSRATRLAHVVAYEIVIGPVKPGLELDHTCRVRACIRPEHLEPVTPRENRIRAHGPAAITEGTGICQRGHKFTPDNWVRRSNGQKQCRMCFRIQNRAAVARYRAKNKMTEEQKTAAFGNRTT